MHVFKNNFIQALCRRTVHTTDAILCAGRALQFKAEDDHHTMAVVPGGIWGGNATAIVGALCHSQAMNNSKVMNLEFGV